MKASRGNESRRHLDAKIKVGELLQAQECTVFYELHECDVLAINHQSRSIVGIEVESTPRNVARNISRNIANGCHAVAILSLTDKFYSQISTKAASTATGTTPVRVFRHDEILSLPEWVLSIS